jgi:hypothetical protein
MNSPRRYVAVQSYRQIAVGIIDADVPDRPWSGRRNFTHTSNARGFVKLAKVCHQSGPTHIQHYPLPGLHGLCPRQQFSIEGLIRSLRTRNAALNTACPVQSFSEPTRSDQGLSVVGASPQH